MALDYQRVVVLAADLSEHSEKAFNCEYCDFHYFEACTCENFD